MMVLYSQIAFRGLNKVQLAKTVRSLSQLKGDLQEKNNQRKEIPKQLISNETDFAAIKKDYIYIDKTLLIKDILSTNEVLYVSAPDNFGKSTNLSMLKYFFQPELSENGKLDNLQINRKNWRKFLNSMKHSKNYQLFYDKGSPYKIINDKYLVMKNFGCYPVILVDCKASNISSYQEALKHCRKIIHFAYLEHKYLIQSNALDQQSKSQCEKWCNLEYENFTLDEIIPSLKHLSLYLTKHYQKEVIILVDNFDSIMTEAVLGLRMEGKTLKEEEENLRNQLTEIETLLSNLFGYCLKNNNSNLKRAYLTGVSGHLPLSGQQPFRKLAFLENHSFVRFHGLNSRELDEIIAKVEKNKQKRSNIKSIIGDNYAGYLSIHNNFDICHPVSVLKYLETKKPESYWQTLSSVERILQMFQCDDFKKEVRKLLEGDSVKIMEHDNIELEKFAEMKIKMKSPSYSKLLYFNTLFHYLFVSGYLTPCRRDREGFFFSTSLRIPNEEMYEEFKKLIS